MSGARRTNRPLGSRHSTLLKEQSVSGVVLQCQEAGYVTSALPLTLEQAFRDPEMKVHQHTAATEHQGRAAITVVGSLEEIELDGLAQFRRGRRFDVQQGLDRDARGFGARTITIPTNLHRKNGAGDLRHLTLLAFGTRRNLYLRATFVFRRAAFAGVRFTAAGFLAPAALVASFSALSATAEDTKRRSFAPGMPNGSTEAIALLSMSLERRVFFAGNFASLRDAPFNNFSTAPSAL